MCDDTSQERPPIEVGTCLCSGIIHDYELTQCCLCGEDIHVGCVKRCRECGREGCQNCHKHNKLEDEWFCGEDGIQSDCEDEFFRRFPDDNS